MKEVNLTVLDWVMFKGHFVLRFVYRLDDEWEVNCALCIRSKMQTRVAGLSDRYSIYTS